MGTIGTLPGDRLAGLLIDQIEKIRKGAITLDELALFTQRKNPFEPKVEARPTKLLEYVTTVEVPGVERFVAKDYFKKDTSKKAKVKIAWMSENFIANFVPKVEIDVPKGDVKVHRLLKPSLDTPIMKELGEKETYLDDLLALLEKQPSGEDGPLLVNGYANICYIRDVDCRYWAVDVGWYSGYDGWYVSAYPVSYPDRWGGGDRVVSR